MTARFPLLFAWLALGLSHAGFSAESGGETFAPKVYGLDHYQQIWKRSPFIVETVAVTQSAGLATKYGLVGMASMNNMPVVFLLDKNEGDPGKSRFMVSKDKVEVLHNIELVSVSISPDARQSSAVIKQGVEQATIPFEAAGLPPTGPVGNAGGVPMPAAGYVPPPSAGIIPPPPGGIIAPGAPNPAVRIQSNPVNSGLPTQPLMTPNPGDPNVPVPPNPTRRIIRPKSIDVNP